MDIIKTQLMSNVQIYSSDLQFNDLESALGYHNFFKSSKISALLEIAQVSKQIRSPQYLVRPYSLKSVYFNRQSTLSI
jgi:hypothetical protein